LLVLFCSLLFFPFSVLSNPPKSREHRAKSKKPERCPGLLLPCAFCLELKGKRRKAQGRGPGRRIEGMDAPIIP
jgi:hypothetical protein